MAAENIRYLNRELSWLEFNERVLGEALDRSVPLLERVKFLSITASNLDEFFMVRVGGLMILDASGDREPDPSGMPPLEQLLAIRDRVERMTRAQYGCYGRDLKPALAKAGLRHLAEKELSAEQRAFLELHFEREVYPMLSPVAVENEAVIGHLRGLDLHVAVRLAPSAGGGKRFAVVPVPSGLKRVIALPSESGFSYMLSDEVVRIFADRLFAGEKVVECASFRITRNADMSVEEDKAADLLSQMERLLVARKESHPIRLEAQKGMSRELLGRLQAGLGVGIEETYLCDGPVNLKDLMELSAVEGFDSLRYAPWLPQTTPEADLRGASVFSAIAKKDIILFHPYESYDPVIRLLEEAADDPDVLAIKQILYRTSRSSSIVAALSKAALRGKSVTALVELKARFDEARNIEWARRLERDGVHVIYGVKGHKTHAKLALIVRREPRGIVRYMHFGTGNYNEVTAKLYSDVSLMTCDEDFGRDASAFFNAVTGYSQPQQFRRLEAAPFGLRERIVERIEEETERKRHGQKAFIMAKVNSLVDRHVIDALYKASKAGVKILLNVRGVCCLKPGVKGMSENITVVSIVDRFLEHSRIIYFHHGGAGEMYISSADWMPRNLARRVELLVPVLDESCRTRLKAVLETYFSDTAKAHFLQSDGKYARPRSRNLRRFRSQEALYRQACAEVKAAAISKRTALEPHKPPDSEL